MTQNFNTTHYCNTLLLLMRLSDNVILRRQSKNLESVTAWDSEILRGVYPELVEGLRMTILSIREVV